MDKNIAHSMKKSIMALLVKIRPKGFYFLYSFKRSLKKEVMQEPYLSTKIICQRQIGASKLFLHLIHFTRSLIQITDLLKIIEAEEERDSFQVLKTFYLDSQLWTASTHLRIMTSKRKRLLKSLLTANQKINKENLSMQGILISKRKIKFRKWETKVTIKSVLQCRC